MQGWPAGDAPLAKVVWEQTDACLEVYSKDPSRVEQDANNELRISEGGYSRRQLFELMQNAIDAARDGGGRAEILLTETHLYVANDGAPFTAEGVRAVMASDLSRKDDDRIGRFGIGFKSVLAVSEKPMVISRTVAFGFDGPWAAQTIADAGFSAPRYPVMRIARTVDPRAVAASDSNVSGLMEWASTVIVLPLRVRRDDLAVQIRAFPGEFALFSPHMTQIRLRDTQRGTFDKGPYDVTVTRALDANGTVKLGVGPKVTEFHVLSATHRPSAEALLDAGRIASRQEVLVQWAIPRRPRAGIGTFWAYFPTSAGMTLSGIANAPWKLSDDRTNLLDGPFNKELLTTVLPNILADGLASIQDPGDPAGYLDVLPARGREARSWADAVINEPIFAILRNRPSLVDGEGELRRPQDLNQFPDGLLPEWIAAWSEIDDAPRGRWVHPDVANDKDRRLKANRLRGQDAGGSVAEWLESLVTSGTTDASERAVHLAASIARQVTRAEPSALQTIRSGLQSARILRLEDGSFVKAARGEVFVRASADDAGHVFVDGDLAQRPGIRADLQVLGVVVLDRSGEFSALVVSAGKGKGDWRKIWTTSRELPDGVAERILREEFPHDIESKIMALTASSTWRPLGEVMLGGTIVPADARRDRDRLIAPEFHGPDEQLLANLGAVAQPVWRHDAPRESWLDGYEQMVKDTFVKKVAGATPMLDKVEVVGHVPAWPLGLITDLSAESRVEITRLVLARGIPQPWHVQHVSNKSYGRLKVYAPEVWLLRKHGMVATSFGPLSPRRVLAPIEGVSPDVLPIADLTPSQVEALGVLTDADDLTENDWSELAKRADRWSDDDRRAEFYSWLPGRYRPDGLVVRVGPRVERVPIENIGVTSDRAVWQSMLEAHIPALWLDDESELRGQFIEVWEMSPGVDLLQEEIDARPSGEPTYLVDDFPPLKLHLDPADHELKLQRCERLVRLVATPKGQVARSMGQMRDGGRVLVTASQDREVLRQVSDALGLDLDARGIARLLESMVASATNKLRTTIRKAKDDDARLVAAVGVEALRRSVPKHALDALGKGGPIEPHEVAALARAVHGVSILKQLRTSLEDNGLEPPRDWSGRRAARDFVAGLGFPVEWAGFPGSQRPATEYIDGPIELLPLHGFQVFVTERIKALLARIGKDRGVVSLPTGAGKTRVTVQAIVEEVAEGKLSGPVVWIAQSDELCEQAAETWTYVWRALGPQLPMSLGRFWGSNESSEDPGTFQLVIATIQKLDSVRERGGTTYDWLREPSLIIVDEAHTSIAPQYTRVLEWLGRGRSRQDFRPLIGLTATPFRGTSTEETERLVNRYDGNRLDAGAFQEDPYRELQEMGVLATVRQEIIDGVDVVLNESDLADIEKYRRLPGSIGTRLGDDIERSERIVESIAKLPADWTVLLFAPSVENARSMAGLLSHRGIPSVAISAETEAAARRHYVEEFKAGRIRVLTNYDVLTQGFDAPAVRAVYVTRPTFSPNVYQQMIGRGLRGPKNGGSEEVLIVNVQDNFAKFGELLAFRDFEYLWRR